MDEPCKLCGTGDAAFGHDGICRSCARTLGLAPLPPPRRPAVPCARCQGRRFIRVVPRVYGSVPSELPAAYATPLTLTAAPAVAERILLPGNKVQCPKPWNGHGVLETYVCAGCGFVEWYCQDPESIPIGPEHMSDVVDYGGDSPYR
jgi:hypothetical protein